MQCIQSKAMTEGWNILPPPSAMLSAGMGYGAAPGSVSGTTPSFSPPPTRHSPLPSFGFTQEQVACVCEVSYNYLIIFVLFYTKEILIFYRENTHKYWRIRWVYTLKPTEQIKWTKMWRLHVLQFDLHNSKVGYTHFRWNIWTTKFSFLCNSQVSYEREKTVSKSCEAFLTFQ